MADLMDELGRGLQQLLAGNGKRAIPSQAPGVGPETARESDRVALGGRIGSHIVSGGDAAGFGGHGDAVVLVPDPHADVAHLVQQHLLQGQRRATREPPPSHRLRLSKPFSIEAHTDDEWKAVRGPFSLFDGTVGAPSAGASKQLTSITLPLNTPSPVLLLNRYPGALYMSLYIHSFSFVPTAATGTGLTECWFSDPTGSTVGMGVYPVSSQTAGVFQSVGALLTGPITDPGNTTLGILTFNNIGIGGTPTSVYFQLSIGFIAMVPDPYFNEQAIVPPTPADVAAAWYPSAGADGG